MKRGTINLLAGIMATSVSPSAPPFEMKIYPQIQTREVGRRKFSRFERVLCRQAKMRLRKRRGWR